MLCTVFLNVSVFISFFFRFTLVNASFVLGQKMNWSLQPHCFIFIFIYHNMIEMNREQQKKKIQQQKNMGGPIYDTNT